MSTVEASPTHLTYTSLDAAYDWFNAELFGGELPHCLVTLQRHRGARGYFWGDIFGAIGREQTESEPGDDKLDEIALNPAAFNGRTIEQILSTLVHEMAHLWQHHFGKPSRNNYHNRQWAEKMEAVGLIPSDTGQPGGKKTGQGMTHYIEEGGRFAKSCAAFLAGPGVSLWGDRIGELADAGAKAKRPKSKVKYTCPACQANAWAKPETRLMCGECEEVMPAEDDG